MAYNIGGTQTALGLYTLYDSTSITTTGAANQTAYTFSLPDNSSWFIQVSANAVLTSSGGAFNQCQTSVLTCTARRKTGNASKTTVNTLTLEDFSTNPNITIDTNGQDVRIRVNSGGVQDVRWIFDIKIIKNE